MFQIDDVHDDVVHVEVKERFIGAVTKDDQTMSMTFQDVGVKKVLAAVSKICRDGNQVQFDEDPVDCFKRNKLTKKKVMMTTTT